MAKKLFIQQVKPFVELEVKVEGQGSILVGFKAHSIKGRELIAEKWAKFLEDNKENYEALIQNQDKSFFDVLEPQEKLEIMQKALSYVAAQAAFSLERLKEDVLYLKNVNVTFYDEEEILSSFVLEDTRKAIAIEGSWSTPEEALKVLLDEFLDTEEWYEPLLEVHKTSLNTSFKAEQAKN